jgi:hypothetical protein
MQMTRNYLELLKSLHAHNVKYLIVGGYAVSLHSQPRATKDLDLFLQTDPENAKAAFEALAEFGMALQGVSVSDFTNPGMFLQFGRAPEAVDVLMKIDGMKFEDAWPRRVQGVVDDDSGFKAYFISKEDLITSKRAAGRQQDLADVEAIQNADKANGK